MLRHVLRVLFVLAAFALGVGCRKKDAQVEVAASAAPTVTDASAGLLLTWIDERGEFHVEERPADVPLAARDVVRVVEPGKESAAPDEVFVVDLRNAGPDGAYPVRSMKRADFEKIAVERRAKHGAVLAATPPASAPGAALAFGDPQGDAGRAEQGRPPVIIYGASWCGPCHQAAKYLTDRGVPFVEKDIERDGGAAREMQAKLARAGRHGGSIPVLDVRGKLLVGFDPRAVDRALGDAL